jgi:hypothetical protein
MNNLLGVYRRIVELSPVLPDEMFAAAQAQDARVNWPTLYPARSTLNRTCGK